MKYVFIMCSLENVDFAKDTSYALLLGAARRGHEIYHVNDGDMSLFGNEVVFHAVPVTLSEDQGKTFHVGEARNISGGDVDVVFIRTDPPFDEKYLLVTWMLDKLPRDVVVINHPSGIRKANEKIWTTQFQNLVPPTLVTRSKTEYKTFLAKHKDVVLKPTHGFGGQSVFCVHFGDANMHVVFETLSQNGKTHVIIQKFVPQAAEGDKRVLILAGEPLGALLRVHAPDDHRNNFFAGGHPHPTQITARDKTIVRTLAPLLKDLGLFFVGIDIIGEYLIEVNVTSPTCLQEMNRLYHQHLEDAVIEFSENLAKGRDA